jgi:hypothetical protein
MVPSAARSRARIWEERWVCVCSGAGAGVPGAGRLAVGFLAAGES